LKKTSKETEIPVSELIRDSLSDFVNFYDETVYSRIELQYMNGKISREKFIKLIGSPPHQVTEDMRKEHIRVNRSRINPTRQKEGILNDSKN